MNDEIPSRGKDGVSAQWDRGEPAIYFTSGRSVTTQKNDRAPDISLLAQPLMSDGDRLRYADLEPLTDAGPVFRKLDDLLHRSGTIQEDRHTILLKLLLVKLYDEDRVQKAENSGAYMLIQDFTGVPENLNSTLEALFTQALESALEQYNGVLATKASRMMGCSSQVLREASGILCRIRVLGALPHVIQDLFMYFGKSHYRVELAQHFTPWEVIRLVVAVVNPRPNEAIVDPACGTADFLIGAKQHAEDCFGADIAHHLNGYDIASLAVHLSIFNLLLHGDRGHANVQERDTLLHPLDGEGEYHVALCNPPFGSRIVEKRPEVLDHFQMATPKGSGHGLMRKQQEAGLLYIEKCLRSVMPGGRVGVLVPNGYLGNHSERYLEFRRWLLRNARVAAVIGFPRFTFKKAGADVSASALILERRQKPLDDLAEVVDHPVHFNLVEKVGWDLRSNHGTRIYKRDPHDGSEMRDEGGARIPDTDFETVRLEMLTSAAVDAFPWMVQEERHSRTREGWSVQVSEILAHPDLSLDPKRWSRKHIELVRSIRSVSHLQIGRVIRPVNRLLSKKAQVSYRYVEIEKIYETLGAYVADEYFGWELPGRARNTAAPGDIFIANIWSSAGKWMIAGNEAEDGRLIVTNGCYHFELIPGQEDMLPDLVFGLCSEAFKVQMRALATGSDGLSSILLADVCSIVLPKVASPEVRAEIQRRIDQGRRGQLLLSGIVRDELASVAPQLNVPSRSSHVVLV